MSFANLSVKLTADIKDFSRKMSDALKQADKTKNTFASGIGSKASGWVTYAENLSNKYKDATKNLLAHNLGLKDTSRIVQGIIVSQAFYAAANAITGATAALWDFNVALDYMKVTYSALFGSTKVAEDFMSVLQEHSIATIFDYQGLADASKKLLAYGIEYENLMFIMEGLTNLGSMSGDSAALDRIALALGQIYTKGKLSAEEMRQLANAYIPITEILQDKFGLTGDQLKRVGDLNLPAADVINAIVDYANENFGGVGDAAMMTITGLQNRIVDTVKVVGASMMQPLTAAYKSFLAYIAEGLESVRSAYDAGGIGGVFEFLVPDASTQQVIRQFLANVHNLFMTLASVGVVVGNVFGNIAQVVANAFNILSPIVIGFTNLLATLVNHFLSSRAGAAMLRVALIGAAAAFVILKVQAIGALVISAVTKVVMGLSKALVILGSVISKHPIISLLIALAAVLLGVTVSSSKANAAISGLFDTISGATGGTSSEEVLQRVNGTIRDSADAADQFNNRLKDSAGSANELSNAISGAGKQAKKTAGLLSFDEVFKLPEQKDASTGSSGAGGLLGDLENLAAGFSNLSDALIPDIPDFSEFASSFTDNLFGGLDKSISDKIKSAGVGSMIGTLIGLIVGAIFKNPKLGATIGSFLGGIAGMLWDEFEGAVSNAGVGGAAGVWTAISSSLTKAGAAGLGTIVKNAFATGGFSGVWNALANVIKNTGGKAILKGGVVGMAVGFVVDGIAHLLWSWLDEKIASADAESAKVGQTIGSLLGTVIGAIAGGPAGALIGSAIGTFVGGIIGLFWEPIKKFFIELGTTIGTWAADTWTDLSTWWTDVASGFSTWADDTGSRLSTWWEETKSGFSTWWEETKSGFSTWWEDTVKTFSDWDSINSETLGLWWESTAAGFNTWYDDTSLTLNNWWEETKNGFLLWVAETAISIAGWCSDVKKNFDIWYEETSGKINRWWEETKNGFWLWVSESVISFGQWYNKTKGKIDQWVEDTVGKLVGWAESVGLLIGGFGKSVWLAFQAAFDTSTWSSGWSLVSTWFSDLLTSISNWFKNIGPSISSWWDGLWDDKSVSVNTSSGSGGSSRASLSGHAAGGVFNREHIARFAEGNKAEAIIPLENNSAMRPFVDAVSDGILASLAPVIANGSGNSNNLPPLYVGTLIADERGLKELYKKFEIIQLQENARRGIPVTL